MAMDSTMSGLSGYSQDSSYSHKSEQRKAGFRKIKIANWKNSSRDDF